MAEGPVASPSDHTRRRLRLDGWPARVPRTLPLASDVGILIAIMPRGRERWRATLSILIPGKSFNGSRLKRKGPVLHLGDEEREDLNEIATVATLEIAPGHAADGWLLRIVVEDEIGPSISDGESASAAEQQIDLGTFYHEFIRSGRGNANITGEVEGAEAGARLAYLLQSIEKNVRHPERRGAY